MNKQFIYFTGVLALMIAAIIAVPAQEDQVALSNTIMNNTTLNATLNETLNAATNETLNANHTEIPTEISTEISTGTPIETLNRTALNSTPSDNETVSGPAPEENTVLNNISLVEIPSAQNATAPENVTSTVEPENNASVIAEISGPQATPSKPYEKTVFAIGSGLKSNKVFQVNANVRPREGYELGMPVKPVRDLEKMVFVCDIV